MMHEFQLPEWFRMPATAGRSASNLMRLNLIEAIAGFTLERKVIFGMSSLRKRNVPGGFTTQ